MQLMNYPLTGPCSNPAGCPNGGGGNPQPTIGNSIIFARGPQGVSSTGYGPTQLVIPVGVPPEDPGPP